MDTIPNNTLLKYNPDTLYFLRQQYGFDKPSRIIEAIQILEEWMIKQKHFVKKELPKEYLERLLIHNKGSVEKSKTKLDKICTLRTLIPQCFEDYDVDELSLNCQDALLDFVIPTMTPDHCRVYIMQAQENECNSHKVDQYIKLHHLICEYMQLYDYDNGIIYLADWRKSHPMAFMKSVNITDFKKLADIGIEGYSMRIKGIHLLTDSSLINSLVVFLKQMLSAKIGSRIHVHTSLDTVYEYIPKNLLPVEYGGDERPVHELREKLLNTLKSTEFQKYRREVNSARTDEALRPKDRFYDKHMGLAGTFRNLSVD